MINTLIFRCSVSAFFILTVPFNSWAQDPNYMDFNYGQNVKDSEWKESIQIIEPVCRSEISGWTSVKFKAPGMVRAKALCWSQPDEKNDNPWGYDVNLTPKGIRLKRDRIAEFKFNADLFPNGPMNVRIYAESENGQKDIFELQLYNKGGVTWKKGIPKADPPAAKGLELVFSDDFDGSLSISNDGRNARYNAHKPLSGDFSGWPFSDYDGPFNPFQQIDTYLKIAARKEPGTKGSTGLIASVNMDGEGFWVKAPCYMECRLTAQSAPGTWPAFWTINQIRNAPGDELDIIEAYGGRGKGNPNYWGYSCTSHYWGQRDENGQPKKHPSKSVDMLSLGGKSSWSTTFHTYGLYIGLKETIYYFDDIEIFRHPTNYVSRDFPHLFMINYAIGGISGWSIDLERYGNGSDMYVDFVRVYAEKDINKKK
ncbi:glycoside hydrolase family 16 protein [Parabacteroides pacaensis]|uniref:glycoside hydrolase family 16 protein n=1 Tax=Parabacteroides pacaensis TaxID=2086575 RepID=UPI001F32F7A0|nr:glycoside hydrolase family 16 protein [Parabacteroides pacaensis]